MDPSRDPLPDPLPAPGLMRRLLARLWSALIYLAYLLLALVLVFEEWGWEALAELVAQIGRLPILRRVEAGIRRLSPRLALVLLIVPLLTLLPVKFLAVYWLGQGRIWRGIGLILLAKVTGTALTARLFMLTQPTLMTLPWFARALQRWNALRERVLAAWHRSAPARVGRALRRRLKALWRRLRKPTQAARRQP